MGMAGLATRAGDGRQSGKVKSALFQATGIPDPNLESRWV